MKKRFGIVMLVVIMSCFIWGCQKEEKADTSQEVQEIEELEHIEIEGMEKMTDAELNQELIKRADEQEVVPDKK